MSKKKLTLSADEQVIKTLKKRAIDDNMTLSDYLIRSPEDVVKHYENKLKVLELETRKKIEEITTKNIKRRN